MNVVFDHQIFALQPFGGISRYFCELANSLRNDFGQRVDIFAPFHQNEHLASFEELSANKIKVYNQLNLTKAGIWGIDTALAYSRFRFNNNIDIFHETYYSPVDCCPSAARRIITIHDMVHEKFPELFHGRDSLKKARKLSIDRADHIICVSVNTLNDLLSLTDIPENKASVIYHGYSFNKPNGGPLFTPKRPYILYVGQRGGYKNFKLLLRAFAHSEDLLKEFSLICFGGGAFDNEEQRLMSRLGLSKDSVVQLSGNDNLLVSLYCGACAFIYPSLYEGFGIPLLEAMALSCPVICANASCFPEIGGNAVELFDPTDEDCLVSAIKRVVFSETYKKSLIRQGHERMKFFSWNRCASETLQLYLNQIN